MKKYIRIQSVCMVIVMICGGAQTAMRFATEHKLQEAVIEEQFMRAALDGDTEELIKLYGQHNYLLNFQDAPSARSALHYAIYAQQKKSVELLLDLKANVFVKTSRRNTPLHIAVEMGNKEIIKLLLEKHAAQSLVTTLVNTPNEDGNTPLHIAAKPGNVEIVELLLSYGAQTSLRNKYGKTASEGIVLPPLTRTTTQHSLGNTPTLGKATLDIPTFESTKVGLNYTKKKRPKLSLSRRGVLSKKKKSTLSEEF